MNIFLMIFLVAVGQLTGCKSVSNGKLTENKDTGGGNTGDLRARERRLAWFIGKSTLKYCIKMGEDVSSPLAPQLDKTFQQAFEAWMPIVSQVNQRLAETNGKVLPTSLQRQSGCAGADLVVGFGSQWSEEDVGIRDVMGGSRESNLSAGYSLPQTQSMLLWIAGTAEAPAAQGLGASTFAKNINYANMNDVSVTLRYTIGRMLGNVDIPGTIMAFLPERWIACANAEDPTCVRVVNTNIVEDQFQVLGESTKPIKGCVGGALPAEFTNAQKNLSLSAVVSSYPCLPSMHCCEVA